MGAGEKLSRRVALTSIAAGFSFIALDTYSFTVAEAGRGTSLGATSDADALLGIDGKTADVTPTFTNNFDTALALELAAPGEGSAEFDVGTDGSASDQVSFTLDPGETVEVGMSANASEITVDARGTYDNGSIQLQRDFEIPQAGQVDLTARVIATGNSGKFSFGLANTGSIDAVMDSIRVDGTSVDGVNRVAHGQIFRKTDDSDDGTGRQLISSPLTVGETGPLTDFDERNGTPDTVLLESNTDPNRPGPEVVFEFDRFRTADEKHGKMKGATVTVTVGFEDGSTRQFGLED